MAEEELKRHFAVLTEHLDSKIALLAEGQAALGRRIDDLEKAMRDEFLRWRPTSPISRIA